VTFGVVVLLPVAHQLWWTNLRDHASAQRRVQQLERVWGTGVGARAGDGAGTASSGADRSDQSASARAATASQGYAVLRIPRLGVTAPVAESIGKAEVPTTWATTVPGQRAGVSPRAGAPRTVLGALVIRFRLRVATRILSVVRSRKGGVPHDLAMWTRPEATGRP
jgi:hypothetical protein